MVKFTCKYCKKEHKSITDTCSCDKKIVWNRPSGRNSGKRA